MNYYNSGIKPVHPLTSLMNNKWLLVLIFTILSAHAAPAQNSDDHSTRNLYLDFGGSVGVFIPYDNVKDKKTNFGSNAMTSLQLNYHQNYFVKLQFGQTAVNFKSQNTLMALDHRSMSKPIAPTWA